MKSIDNKIQYFNNLRALSCFLVILTHSAMPALDSSFGVYMMMFSFISSPSSELFITLSSSLLVPTKLGLFEFYKKRFSKLLGPVVFWSLLIIFLNFINGKITITDSINNIILMPIQPVIGVYWFIYVIIGLYLIIPIVSPWIEKASKKDLLMVILIWCLTLFLPYVNIIFKKDVYILSGNYYFVTNYLGGFIGYLFLGVYLRKYPILIQNKFKLFSLLFILLIIALVPYGYGYGFNRSALVMVSDNLSLSSVSLVIMIFTLFQNIQFSFWMVKIVNLIAKYSFGIYLIHIIVVRDLIWEILENNRLFHPVIETPFIAVISLMICILIVRVLSFLPKSKYIIGA